MAVSSFQMKLSGNLHVPLYGESKQCSGDAIYNKCSFMNNETTRWAEDLSAMDKEQGMGDVPVPQQEKHLGRHRRAFLDHQTDIALFQMQPSINRMPQGTGR
jgi:hypothetical protein